MSRRWKETSFLSTSRTGLKVPVDVALEESYGKLHRSIGDLRPSRSQGSRNHYHPRTMKDDNVPYASSMDVIPGSTVSKTEISMTECEEIGILEGNQVIPIASFQRDFVMAKGDNIRRAESLSTFASAGIARNANSTEVSYASGWQKQRVVVKNSESESSMVAMRASSSSSHVLYQQGDNGYTMPAYGRPNQEDIVQRSYSGQDIYENTMGTQDAYGYEAYPRNDRTRAPQGTYRFEDYPTDHIYDEIRASDVTSQQRVQNYGSYSHEDLYENLRKPVIISERLKGDQGEREINPEDCIYENVRSSNIPKQEKELSFSEEDLGNSQRTHSDNNRMMQAISDAKSTPNLSGFSKTDHDFTDSVLGRGNKVKGSEGNIPKTVEPKRDDTDGEAIKEKTPKLTNKMPYLETNLDDILWLPTPTKTEPKSEPIEKSSKAADENQRKFSPSHDGRKSRTSNMSIKRPSCPPPPPPKTVVKTEDSSVPEVPAVDLTPYTELSPSLTPDPAENTLNLAFISSADSSLAQDHHDMSIHASQDIPVDYYPDEKDHVESSEPYSSFEKEDEMDNEELRESEQERERTIEEGQEPENIQNQRLIQEDMRTEKIVQDDTNADVQESEGINIKVQEQKDKSLEEQEQMGTKSEEEDEARLVNQVHKDYGIETETETLSSTEALEVGPSLEESKDKQIDDHDYATEPITEQQLPDFITIEEKENELPPPYAPPPPPPESDSSETLSAGSVDLSFSDMEGTLSPSPPPRPPSPISYTGVTSTSPLYYYPSHMSVTDNYLDSHLSPSSPSPSQEESASVSMSHSSDQLDPRHSPSPPPIPPRPKNIEKPLFYRSLPELDLGRHIYENVKFLHDESNDASGYRDVETRRTYNEDVIRDEEDGYESFYEDMLHPELQIDDIDRHEGHEVYTDECIYENITRPTVSIVNLSDLEKHTEEDIYANVENSQIYSRITGTSRGDLSGEGRTATRVLGSPSEDSDRYESIQGHTYATIDKPREKGVDTPAFKGNSRDHTYDSISTSLIHSDDADEYDEYSPGRRYLLMNKSPIHQGDQDDKEKGYSEHTYATVNKSGKKSKGNVSGNDGSFLDHTYSVIDKSQSRKAEEPIYDDYDRDEIYENTSSILAYTRNMAELGEEHPEEESIYENLNFLRQRMHDARQSQRALPPDQPADEDDHAVYSNLTPTSSGTFSSDSLSHLRQGRAETASERPPTPPPRHRPPPEGIPLPPVYSPPPPPTPPPPDTHEAQEAEYSSFVNHNNAVRGYLETANEARERDGSFDYQREVQQLLFIQKQRHRRRKQLRQQQPQEHNESGSRAMMEFYVNTLTSDSDSDNDSSTASSSTSASGGSHDLEEEEHVLERTYQVMGCADTVLDTIEEDVEEDSGAESSGHWMFSADSTDTDSVIHVPAILDLRPYPVEAVKEAESTDSDSTLIVEEEEDVDGVCCTEVAKGNSSSSEQEAGVTEGNSHVGAPATDHHHHFEASASDEADEDSDSRGVDTVVLAGGSSLNQRAKTRRRREGDNSRRKKNLPLGDAVRRGLPRQANMLSRNEAAKLFEKHIDDVFDFESLESCESVYGGNDDTIYPSQGCTSPLAGEEVVFNTSATSQPFADASRGMEADPINSERIGEDVVDFSKDAGEFIVNQRVELHSKDGEGSLPLPQTPTSHDITPLATIHDPHAHGEIHYDSEYSEFDLNKSANSENTLLDQTYIIGNSECQYEKENTISNVCETPVSSHTPVTNLSESALTSVNDLMDSKMTETDCDENQIPTGVTASEGLAFTRQSSEPISMDLFGLPVRWTEDEKKKSPAFMNSDDIETPVAPYACKIQKICKTNLEPLTNNESLDRNNDVDNFKYDDMKTHNDTKLNNDYNQELALVTKASLKDDSDHDVCENEKVTATERVAVSEGDFTFTSSSLSSSSSSSSTLAVSETSEEAHHYQATTGNLLQSSACHRELSVFPSVAGDSEGASRCITEPLLSENQDDSDRETITMRDRSTSDSKTLESHKNYPSTLTTDNANEPQQPIGGEPQYVKTQRHIENFSSRYYEGEIKNDCTICQQHPSPILQGGDVRQYGNDLPSGNSDTDTDNTDGDYDEEDHFAAELSLRISTVHSEGHSGVGSGGSECRSFRNTDILSVLTATGGKEGAGHEDATGSVSPLASQEGSSPEMPDSLRSSEGRSGTRSIETLSEDSGLGDRDVRLTPSSPLPSISEGGTRGAPSSSQGSQQSLSAVTVRPRRQDIRQARIARARSCSDLRVYSDSSDTDTEEENDMHGWHSRSRGGGTVASNINGTAYNGGTYASKPFKSSYANYLQEQYRGEGENVHERHFDNLHPTSPPSRYQHLQRSHPLSGSDGSDEEIKSRYRRVRETSANNYSRPRRYKSLLEFPSKEDYYNASQNSGSDFYKDTQRVPRGVGSAQPRGSRRRREPLSVDLAEEFLSQELQTSKSKHDDKRNGDAIRLSGDKLPGDRGPPSASSRGGAGDEASYHMSVTNQIARSELKTNGVEVGGVLRGPQGSWGEEGLAGCKDEGRADVRVQCGWPHASTTAAAVATAPTAPYPHHHPLDAHHQLPSPPHLTPSSSSQRQPQHQYSSSSPAQLPNECQPVRTGHSGNTAPPHDPFAQSDPSTNLPQQEEQEQPFIVTHKATSNDPIQTVQEDNMAEVPVRVRTKTYGSHGEVEVYLARADSGRPPPHPAASASSPVLTPTGGAEHRTGSRGVTFSPSVKEVNWRESYYEVEPEGDDVIHPTKSTSEVESSRKTPNRVETGDVMQQQEETRPFPIADMQPNNNTTTGKINGNSFDPSTGSSSEAELGEEKGQQQKSSTPIWQRFKLPKISSPKSPRPKILPKPKSLSPRSSDTEISNPMSPDSSSSTPSSPDSKLKKIPPSPKFFSWGSKREKKPREITRPTTAPPPVPPQPPQVSAGQGGGGGSRGGQTGEPDSPSVTLTALNREGRGDAPLIISAKKNQVITSDSSEDRVVRSALAKRHIHKSVPSTLTTSASSSNNSGKEEEEELDRRSQSVSSSGDDTADTRGSSSPSSSSSPRSAVAKPPLPPHLQRPTQQAFHKARLLSARRHYFSQERQVSPPKDNTTDAQDGPTVAPPAAHTRSAVTSAEKSVVETVTPTLSSFRASPPRAKPSLLTKGSFDSSKNLKERFERFSASTRAERERLARSTPDLSVIRASVRRPGQRIDSCTRGGADEQQQQATSAAADIHVAASPASASDGEASNRTNAHQGATHTQSKPRQAIHERYKNRAQRIYARSRTQSTGVLETDLDTGASRELLTLRETNLDDLYKDLQHLLNTLPSVGGPTPTETKARAKSLLDLEAASSDMEGQLEPPTRPPDTRAKSMEFLLDDGNKAAIQPPENELMKGSERQLSEAELRVRRSLQRLDVPEWMKNAQPQQQGFLLRRRDYGSSSMTGGGGGWSAFSSKTASMTSLGSSRAHTPNTPTKVVIPTRVASKGTTGLGGLTSPASNASISPSPSDRSGSLFQYPSSRWSTSRLNSGTTTPTGSVTSTRTTPATYVRQPYLGWRSQTSLASLAGSQSSLTNTGTYLTAADRLALGITSYSQRFVKPPPVSVQDKENSSAQANAAVTKSDNAKMNDEASTNGNIKLQVPTDVADVHSSIKEVTSAIVHYCNESTPSPRASPRGSPRPEGPRAPSPRRLVWVESSFVGSRPITSPETPTSSTHAITPTSQLNGHEEPESNEAPSQPPQPPGEYLLAW